MAKKSKKRKKRSRVGEITLNILEHISFALEIATEGILNPYELQKKMKYDGSDTARFFDHLRGLERTGYIEIKIKDRQKSIELTNKGKIKLLESSLNKQVDGHWRMISFDIPEEWRHKRNTFRRTIKRIGFKQIQKSLWACPFNKADEIALVINDLKINKYVAYLVVEKTDIENFLKRKFRLNENTSR